jgi:putative oxidoreductase
MITKLYLKYTSVLDHGRSLLLLAVRLYWGWQFVQTGWGKLTHIDKITEYFRSLGVPVAHANAYMVGTLEFTGGILLILGLGSRLITLPLTVNMLVAYHFGDPEALHAIFSNPGKFYGADPYTFLFASLLVLIFGAGVFSVDGLIGLALRAKSQVKSRSRVSMASTNAVA